MQLTERKQKDYEEAFIQSADEAKVTLQSIHKDISKKHEKHLKTLEKVKDKCLNQFDTQKQNYDKFAHISQHRQHAFSQGAVNKFNLQQQKANELAERVATSVEDHRNKNEERFYTRDEGLKKAKDERNDFLRKEDKRHKDKLEARDHILRNISVEHAQKIEMRKLRFMDANSNLERERFKR